MTAVAVRLNIHGCRVVLNSASERLRRDIAEDFAYFCSGAEGAPEITIRACCRAVTEADLAGHTAAFRTNRLTILRSAPGTRAVWYPEGALSVFDRLVHPALLQKSGAQIVVCLLVAGVDLQRNLILGDCVVQFFLFEEKLPMQ